MDVILHILDRFQIHFFASPGVMLLVLHALLYIRRKVPESQQWIPVKFNHLMVLAALLVAMGAFSREAYDVSCGQPLVKAITDYISWLVGQAFGVFAIYRLKSYIIAEEKAG
jgi:hypothetical protein